MFLFLSNVFIIAMVVLAAIFGVAAFQKNPGRHYAALGRWFADILHLPADKAKLKR